MASIYMESHSCRNMCNDLLHAMAMLLPAFGVVLISDK